MCRINKTHIHKINSFIQTVIDNMTLIHTPRLNRQTQPAGARHAPWIIVCIIFGSGRSIDGRAMRYTIFIWGNWMNNLASSVVNKPRLPIKARRARWRRRRERRQRRRRRTSCRRRRHGGGRRRPRRKRSPGPRRRGRSHHCKCKCKVGVIGSAVITQVSLQRRGGGGQGDCRGNGG